MMLVEGDESGADFYVCLMCVRRMGSEAMAIAHLQAPFHRTMFLV